MPDPTPRDVIKAALAAHLPSGHDALDERAELVELALREYGHLPALGQVLTDEHAEQLARDLAVASGHPRYSLAEGHKLLLTVPTEVTLAHRAAQARAAGSEARRSLDGAAERLLAWHDARRASTEIGR